VLPFEAIVDAIAVIFEMPPLATEWGYELGDVVGPGSGIEVDPSGSRVPVHVLRCPDAAGPFLVGRFSVIEGLDSPGEPNRCAALELMVRTIPEIQGRGHRSPLEGARVDTQGLVTAVDANGFYLQDPAGDGDPFTSDAIFVFTRSRPEVSVGDWARVVGSVEEFIPGGAFSANLSVTELRSIEVTVLDSGWELPATIELGRRGRIPPAETIDDDGLAIFDPEQDGLDFFETLEGMRVRLRRPRVVGPSDRLGVSHVVVERGAGSSGLNRRGTLNVSSLDFNPERIAVRFDRDLVEQAPPRWDVGVWTEDLIGVLDYAFGNYSLQVTQPAAVIASRRAPPEQTWIRRAPQRVSVASLNVRNLDPNDTDGDDDVAEGRFDAIARAIVDALRSPDIIALQEIQDDDGRIDSGITSAAFTLQRLVDAVRVAGGPTYSYADSDFVRDGAHGGEPGGNIRVAYLYDRERVELVAGSLLPLTDPELQQNDAANPFFRSRIPLVATFRRVDVVSSPVEPTDQKPFARSGRADGEVHPAELTLINCHFSSKIGSAPLFGRIQPSVLLQEDPSVNAQVDVRRAQAQAVVDFVQSRLRKEPRVRIAVLGDFNELELNSPLADVLGSALTNLTFRLQRGDRYSFLFEGNAQALDHVLVSSALRAGALYDAVHIHSELAESSLRGSDHDPVIASFRLPLPRRSRWHWLGF